MFSRDFTISHFVIYYLIPLKAKILIFCYRYGVFEIKINPDVNSIEKIGPYLQL